MSWVPGQLVLPHFHFQDRDRFPSNKISYYALLIALGIDTDCLKCHFRMQHVMITHESLHRNRYTDTTTVSILYLTKPPQSVLL